MAKPKLKVPVLTKAQTVNKMLAIMSRNRNNTWLAPKLPDADEVNHLRMSLKHAKEMKNIRLRKELCGQCLTFRRFWCVKLRLKCIVSLLSRFWTTYGSRCRQVIRL